MVQRGQVIRQRIVRSRLFETVQPLTAFFGLAPDQRVERHSRVVGIFLLGFLQKCSFARRASGGEEGRIQRRAVEDHHRLSARPGVVVLHVSRGVGDDGGERRVLGGLAPPGRAHQRLPHRILQGTAPTLGDVDGVDRDQARGLGRQWQHAAGGRQGERKPTHAPACAGCFWDRSRHGSWHALRARDGRYDIIRVPGPRVGPTLAHRT